MKRNPVLNFLASVKVAIVLLIIIILASILGTLIPQERSAEEYAFRYGQIGSLFQSLQLTKLYKSVWYLSILFLFTLNILTCTVMRFSPKFKRAFQPKFEAEPKNILALKVKDRFKTGLNLGSALETMKNELSRLRYRVQERREQNKTYLTARKKITGLFGSDVVHLGLLVILAGGITSGLGGFRADLTMHPEQTMDVPRADFALRLDKFETEYYPDGGVKDWKSHLTVLEGNEARLSKIVEVNHPLSYKGFHFYQSAYGRDWQNPLLEVWVKKKSDPSFTGKLNLRLAEKAELGDGLVVAAVSFLPDFVLGEGNRPVSRSNEPNNPAVFLEGWSGAEKVFAGWVFSKFPDFTRMHSNKEPDLSFELKNFSADQYSVLQMAKDPGVNLIWAGCIVLMAGLFFAFYWAPREVKVILEEAPGKTEITSGGIASKGREAFESELNEILTAVRRQP